MKKIYSLLLVILTVSMMSFSVAPEKKDVANFDSMNGSVVGVEYTVERISVDYVKDGKTFHDIKIVDLKTETESFQTVQHFSATKAQMDVCGMQGMQGNTPCPQGMAFYFNSCNGEYYCCMPTWCFNVDVKE